MNTQPKKTSIWAGFGTMFSKIPPVLFVCWMITAILNILFGYDTTSFGGVQSIPAFEREFGNPTGPDGSYEISPSRALFMSSIGFAGKVFGALVCLYSSYEVRILLTAYSSVRHSLSRSATAAASGSSA